eukprot:TRINITY_DN5489_c0_g2_i2.p1 TRINITY_DN5489_c0_g2~~TRINITY_DN5489_c0_g2_i2.p1  ORF type:complete len:355 (-),score=54.35 TRINITY_DN5489_c0_g2_i2:401-1465(-)
MSDSKLQVTLAAALGLGVGVGVGAVALTAASRGSRREGRRKGSAKLIGHLTSACCPSPPEPDSEPETESVDHEHREFVRVLRVRYEKEDKSPEFWTTADLEANSPIMFAIENVKQYFKEWQGVGHDPFWQRKSKKIVIAAVVCRSDNGLVAYRGMNTEVSLPSGSLCAERAAIARAASEWRAAHDIVAVAVLDPADTINPLWPCEVCQSWLAKLRDENSAISVIAFKDLMCSEFVVRVNGVLQPRPRRLPPPPPKALHDRIVLAEGVQEYPWEARHLVYVDGSWEGLVSASRSALPLSSSPRDSRGRELRIGRPQHWAAGLAAQRRRAGHARARGCPLGRHATTERHALLQRLP